MQSPNHTVIFSSDSQDDDLLPWKINYNNQEVSSSTFALTEAWNLLHQALKIPQYTEELFATWEENYKSPFE